MESFQQLSVKSQGDSNLIHCVPCKGCEAPQISGIRYKCSICSDFDLCENCEDKFAITHNHPFLKIRIPFPEKDFIQVNMIEEPKFSPVIEKPYLSAKCISPNAAELEQGEYELKVTVELENNGNINWPEDCHLRNIHGIFGDKVKVQSVVKPGEKISLDVIFTTKNLKVGEYTSRWQIHDGRDICFGCFIDIKFKVNLKKDNKRDINFQEISIKSNDQKVVYRFYNKLHEMKSAYSLDNISNEKILAALEKSNGNLDEAVAHLF